MDKWIKRISGVIPHTNTTVDIELNGKNLIVTGANGSGKTSFLRAAHENLDGLIAKKGSTALTADLQLDIPDSLNFSARYDDRKAIIRFFEERRLAEIILPTAAKAVAVEEENAKRQDPAQKFANNLEQHLVNLITRQSLAITMDKNQALADKIAAWFAEFEQNLKILFEDNDATLKFNPDTSHFSICQPNKPPYTFQTLSAGYRAIFDIYAELIMRTEYFKVMPKELTGVVFIDEIDSHLHVSLQRLILPFFTQSFPNIQFIVTTHSPFVLMSTPDTVVFDLG
jgi:predicted ATP-binding protein involved in virulence